MAFRNSVGFLSRRALPSALCKVRDAPTSSICQRGAVQQLRSFASHVPPVTQDDTGSKGPTAMVFMNMGGPATTDEVGDFLSRLFVRPSSN